MQMREARLVRLPRGEAATPDLKFAICTDDDPNEQEEEEQVVFSVTGLFEVTRFIDIHLHRSQT